MDFRNLQGIQWDVSNHNGTLTSLPSTLLEAFIPGYGIVSQIIFKIFGFDVGLVVSGCLVVFGLSKGAEFLYHKASGVFSSYFKSRIQIEDHDELYNQIMEWVAEQSMTKVSRDLMAVTKYVSAYDDDEESEDDDDVLDESGIFNFEKWASNIPPRYEPNFGRDRFKHEGRTFHFSRTRKERKSPWGASEDETMLISCVGRSTEPIKDLLNHIKSWTLTKENKMTTIYRSAPKSNRDYPWEKQATRPSRPMSTVSLDQQQKAKIVMNINEYLHPASARWYAARGIPYRRGYLFHGPPGTGKTSLSFALADIFGLPIYCISLMEVGLTESDLNKLFARLQRRCIVLLEDIDSAGLRRSDEPAELKNTIDDDSDSSSETEEGLTKVRQTDAGIKTPEQLANGTKSLISLSGLLNVIDGIASHEGRVLIMTTNHPEKLDPALIRPGRVDLQVQFTLATHDQIHDIFKRMYSGERSKKTDASTGKAKLPGKKPCVSLPRSRTYADDDEDEEFLQMLRAEPVLNLVEPEKLKEMAEEFASQIPEGKFSPAEIQGFLLMRKKEPSKALEEVGKWRDGMLEAKAKDVKILGVQ